MTRSIIVCEGFFDVVTPSQAQIEHIVSTCGTALTETQAEMVLSLADRVFFCFDGDAAGAKATWRAAEMLVPLASDQHEIRLCRLPADEDPDSFVRKFGAPKFQEALDASPTLTAYLIGEITRGAKLPEARARSLSVAASLWRQFSARAWEFSSGNSLARPFSSPRPSLIGLLQARRVGTVRTRCATAPAAQAWPLLFRATVDFRFSAATAVLQLR